MNNRLPDLRDEHGISQAELAEDVDVTRQTINAIERERCDPSLQLAFALADRVDCRIEDIFTPDDETEP